mgnify:CR=1 FL=1
MLHVIPKSYRTFRFSSHFQSTIIVSPGDYLLFYTQDAHNGTIDISQPWHDVSFPELDQNSGNPVTGLVSIKNAPVGKFLRVKILQIIPDLYGVLPVRSYMGIIRNVIPNRLARVVKYQDQKVWITENLALPARPMVGTIGVAPKTGEAPTITAGSHGGNMDDNYIDEGAEVLFLIQQNGALLGIGDVHAAMGEGELTCGGVDICAQVLVQVDVVDSNLPLKNPVVMRKGMVITHGFGNDYSEAARGASEEMANLLREKLRLSKYEAVLLMAARGDLGLCQACLCESSATGVRMAFPILW